ncbi:hypothetical protein [Pseudonocardia sp. KRD291]|uniref:hypothetical protein n=1 Tax=Pseudonocardia sp. KRD291 TaxID=2792007 RepID=UPI001C49E104|nr:hypothetical protein [Pseudonocardia sp. KRD291]MBW0105145.1 ketohydroxyglutarate aldolase [Pseudonocardia sp. KRD291]
MSEKVTISIADGHLDRIDEVVARLEQAGVQVEKVLRGVGVVIGSVEESGMRALGVLDGVGSVEPDRTVQLPPPDSDVQ